MIGNRDAPARVNVNGTDHIRLDWLQRVAADLGFPDERVSGVCMDGYEVTIEVRYGLNGSAVYTIPVDHEPRRDTAQRS